MPFQNTSTGPDVNFLHVDASYATQTESGAVNIANYSDDYDGEVRQGNPGYAGTGSAPDIGADEFSGYTAPVCEGIPQASAIVGPGSVCSGAGTILILSAQYPAPGIVYQWASSTTPGGPYTNLGTDAIQATGNLNVNTYYICTIICLNTGVSYITSEKTVTVDPLPTATSTSNSPVCEGSAIILSGQTNGTSFIWTGPDNFTSTLQNPVISPAVVAGAFGSRTYTFTAFLNGCSSSVSTTIVIVQPHPDSVQINPSSSTIAPGGIQQLTATGGKTQLNGNTGFGGAFSAEGTPYRGSFGGSKTQSLYLAGELTAMGLTAGAEITSISFSIHSFTGPFTFNNFTISIKNTASTVLSATLESGAVTVLAPTNFTLSGTAPFIVTHELTSPFTWDGTSNLLVETCFNNTTGGSSENSAEVSCTQLTANMNAYFSANNAATLCTNPGVATLSVYRPDIDFGFNLPASITWSPFSGLFTDAGATDPYTGTVTNTVYASPSVTTIYTATSVNTAGCTASANATVSADDLNLQNITIVEGESNCYDATGTIYVAGSGTTFTVYSSSSAILIAGQKIIFYPGATFNSGGYMHAYITNDGQYCSSLSNPLVNSASRFDAANPVLSMKSSQE